MEHLINSVIILMTKYKSLFYYIYNNRLVKIEKNVDVIHGMQVRACRPCCMMFPFLTSRSSCRPKGIAASASLGRKEHKLQNSSEPTEEFLLTCLTSSISSRHNHFKITICRSRPLNWIYVYVINCNNVDQGLVILRFLV